MDRRKFITSAGHIAAGFAALSSLSLLNSCSDMLNAPLSPGTENNQEPEFLKNRASALSAWNPSGWQNAILLEAKHALSRRNDGTSSQIATIGTSRYYVGDYDYVSSDPLAREKVSVQYGWNWDLIGTPGGCPEYSLTKNWRTVGRGGMCKFFADLVQWRATGGRKGFLPSNSSASGSIATVEPSDIIQKLGSPDHTAVVIAILARNSANRVTAVDVIDSNYVGTTKSKYLYIIGRHPISGNALQQYRVYR